MDVSQLIKDIVTFNFRPFKVRFHKVIAIINRRLFSNNKSNRKINFKNIPIIINNRNRLTYLKQLINWLEKNGYSNIYIIDNNSNYQPLLNYYKTINYKIFHLSENVGHLSLWKTDIIKQFEKDYYVYTDPDVLPIEECPDNILEHFYNLLIKYSSIEKVGFALKIDDLPNCYIDKSKVAEWEQKFWNKEIEKDVYDAAIDTTFALYKPFTNGNNYVQNALRTAGKYQLHHLPWYEDSNNENEENIFYKKNIKKGASHWIIKNEK